MTAEPLVGRIDTTYLTHQRDMFESGLVAQIGANSFAVWSAIKAHADFNAGISWPSMRRIQEWTGLASATVQRSVESLEAACLLRVKREGRKNIYIARERLVIRLGGLVVCTIVIDYVPADIHKKLRAINESLKIGEPNPDAFAGVDIIPGDGFSWNPKSGMLSRTVRYDELPSKPVPELADGNHPLATRIKEIQERARADKK